VGGGPKNASLFQPFPVSKEMRFGKRLRTVGRRGRTGSLDPAFIVAITVIFIAIAAAVAMAIPVIPQHATPSNTRHSQARFQPLLGGFPIVRVQAIGTGTSDPSVTITNVTGGDLMAVFTYSNFGDVTCFGDHRIGGHTYVNDTQYGGSAAIPIFDTLGNVFGTPSANSTTGGYIGFWFNFFNFSGSDTLTWVTTGSNCDGEFDAISVYDIGDASNYATDLSDRATFAGATTAWSITGDTIPSSFPAITLFGAMPMRPTGGCTSPTFDGNAGSDFAVRDTGAVIGTFAPESQHGGFPNTVDTFACTMGVATTGAAIMATIFVTPLAPAFAIGNNPTEVGLTETFTDGTGGGFPPYTYAWKFGDGGTSTATNPTHVYTAPGVYQVNETVTDSQANTASAVQGLGVVPHLLANVSAVPVRAFVAPTNCSLNVTTTLSFGITPYTGRLSILNSTGFRFYDHNGSSVSTAFFNATFTFGLPIGVYTVYFNTTDAVTISDTSAGFACATIPPPPPPVGPVITGFLGFAFVGLAIGLALFGVGAARRKRRGR